MLTEYYEQGRDAAFDGLHIKACPYRLGTAERIEWRDGWLDAIREGASATYLEDARCRTVEADGKVRVDLERVEEEPHA